MARPTTSETVTNRLRFAGRELESESGLYYNNARWYDPQLHRFISEDLIGIAGGMNLYAYTGNDPVNFVDPTGLLRGKPKCPTSVVTARNRPDAFCLALYVGGVDLGEFFWFLIQSRSHNSVQGPTSNEGGSATGRSGRERDQEEREAAQRRASAQCYAQNRFSSLFGGGAVSRGVEFAETGSVPSLATDVVAISMKSARSGVGGSSNVYAGGIRMITKRVGRSIGSETLVTVGHRVGDKVTPVLAVLGAFTIAYNTTIDLQCRAGLLQ